MIAAPDARTEATVAARLAEAIARRGTRRVYGLSGGHVQPLWDELDRAGVTIVDVRHEVAAVHMAQAESELTGGMGVALVTAGPGVTNAVTGIANALVSRVPVLIIAGRTPRPQTGMGALQELPQADLVRSLCRSTCSVVHQRQVIPALDAAWRAAVGIHGLPGPSYVDLPTDLLREQAQPHWFDDRQPTTPARGRRLPDDDALGLAISLIRQSRRPLVVAGRLAKGEAELLSRWLDRVGALHVASSTSGVQLPASHPASVPGSRRRAMAEADLVVVLNRRLDFSMAYGSSAVFAPDARFVRVGRSDEELSDNRRADVELAGDVDAVLSALLATETRPEAPDLEWRNELRTLHHQRADRLTTLLDDPPPTADGRIHPYALLASVRRLLDPQTILVADGGDILSFARVALDPDTSLDSGPFGCLGVGVPYAVAAALSCPDRRVVCLTGDGSLGFNVMELDTAVRFGARILVVVANNEGWNIERHDQLTTYGGNIVGTELPGCRFDLIGRGLGAYGARVEQPEDLDAVLRDALDRAPAIVDVLLSREPPSPDARSGLATVPDRQALTLWDDAEAARDAR